MAGLGLRVAWALCYVIYSALLAHRHNAYPFPHPNFLASRRLLHTLDRPLCCSSPVLRLISPPQGDASARPRATREPLSSWMMVDDVHGTPRMRRASTPYPSIRGRVHKEHGHFVGMDEHEDIAGEERPNAGSFGRTE
ncbi:hypothetical protein BC629DRAFT_1434783 [Irpex lacteus]|nr:hypothetical protein BC629DRAFT_1434783 [Irpex lacteus]